MAKTLSVVFTFFLASFAQQLATLMKRAGVFPAQCEPTVISTSTNRPAKFFASHRHGNFNE